MPWKFVQPTDCLDFGWDWMGVNVVSHTLCPFICGFNSIFGCLCMWLSSLKPTIRQQAQPWLGSREVRRIHHIHPSSISLLLSGGALSHFPPAPRARFRHALACKGLHLSTRWHLGGHPTKASWTKCWLQHAFACLCWSHVWENIRCVTLIHILVNLRNAKDE